MPPLKTSSSFCLFCYKSIDYCVKTDEGAVSIRKFIKVLNRLVKTREPDLSTFEDGLFLKSCENDRLYEFCSKCRESVNSFNEIFHQLKILELQLNYKLDKIASTVDHANKVPSRWINVNKVIEEHCQNDLGKKVASQRMIRIFRENVVKAADQRRLQSQPRVLLKRIETPAKFIEPSTSVVDTSLISKETIGDAIFTGNSASAPESLVINTKPNEKFTLTESNCRKFYNNNLVCPKCGKKLTTFMGLHIHIENHKDPKEWQWECRQCGRRFPAKMILTAHIKSHTGTNQDSNQNDKDKLSLIGELCVNESNVLTNTNLLETATIFQDPIRLLKQTEKAVRSTESSTSEKTDSFPKEPVDNSIESDNFAETEVEIPLENIKRNKPFTVTEYNCRKLYQETIPNSVCPKCGIKLSDFKSLHNHLENHKDPSEWLWECRQCGKKFVTDVHLKQHIRTHTGEKPFVCYFCAKAFGSKAVLKNHLRKKHGNEEDLETILKLRCNLNTKATLALMKKIDFTQTQQDPLSMGENVEETENGETTKTDPPIKTKVEQLTIIENTTKNSDVLETFPMKVDLPFKNRTTSKEFIDRYLDNATTRFTISCKNCTNLFTNKANLRRHNKYKLCPGSDNIPKRPNSNNKFTCGICGTEAISKKSLKRHIGYHKPPEWKWKCEKCGEKCADKIALKIHSIRHQVNKTLYKCPYCENGYSRKREVIIHVDRYHRKEKASIKLTEENEIKSFGFAAECKICTRKFTNSSKDKIHFISCHDLKGNSEQETFKCTKKGCTAYFLKRNQLIRHGRMEHGVIRKSKTKRPVKCMFCTKKFKSILGLNNHLIIMHPREAKLDEDRQRRENDLDWSQDDSDKETDSDTDADYEMNAIQSIIMLERQADSREQREQSTLGGEQSTKILPLEEDKGANQENDKNESFQTNESAIVHSNSNVEFEDPNITVEEYSCSVDVKQELNDEVILNKLEIREDEGENCDNAETGNLNEVGDAMEVDGVDDMNTFGMNREYLEDGALAELEDLD